ncbi:MAG: hypothetical protein IKD93_04850 [Firmicutes bacterium]|nr:hypothetical protein [Bacillota bacterium]
MEESAMIDIFEEFIEIIQQLNQDAPKIRELYDGVKKELEQSHSALVKAKEELSKAEASGIESISELSSERKKQIDAKIKALDKSVQRAAELQKALGLSVDSVREINEQLLKLSNNISLLQLSVDQQEIRVTSLEKRIAALKTAPGSPEIDYDETLPAIDLFNKYFGKIGQPIVLEKPSYTNDYCFRVRGIDEEQEKLIGRYFRLGKLYGEKDTFPFKEKCRMYNGPTLADVIAEEI